MDHYAGIDVSLESASVCVIDGTGRIMREAKLASEPAPLIAWFGALAVPPSRIGLEAGPLSQWLYAALKEAGLRSNCWRRGTYARFSRRCRRRGWA